MKAKLEIFWSDKICVFDNLPDKVAIASAKTAALLGADCNVVLSDNRIIGVFNADYETLGYTIGEMIL